MPKPIWSTSQRSGRAGRIGAVGFLFFFVKGLLWLLVPALAPYVAR